MKKALMGLGVCAVLASGLAIADVTHFTETLPPQTSSGATPVSNGYDWSLSNGSNAPSATFKGITNTGTLTQTGALTQSGGAVTLSTATLTGGLVLLSQTTTQIASLTASTTGQVIFCSNCVKGNASAGVGLGVICVSTGSTTSGQFILVSSATAITTCQ